MHKVDHIAIAVKSLSASIPLYEKLLGSTCYKTEEVESEKVKTAFFRTGESKIELLEATDPSSVISTFILKKGEGLHHIAFSVNNLIAKIDELKNEGFEFINEIPKKGADNKRIVFLHPKSTNGVLIELCEEMDNS